MRRFVIGCDSGKERMWHLDFLLEKVRETNGHDKWSQKAERERCETILDARSKNEDIKR